MPDDLRNLIIAAVSGVMLAFGVVYSTCYDCKVAGVGIGPSVPWLKVAGH